MNLTRAPILLNEHGNNGSGGSSGSSGSTAIFTIGDDSPNYSGSGGGGGAGDQYGGARNTVAHEGAAQTTSHRHRHPSGPIHVQTPILDPMAASSALASDHWRETLSMQTMWSLKLTLLLWIAVALSLFVYARGDPLAVQLVSSVSVMCVLFYSVRIDSRAAHADRVALHVACAWVAHSAFTAFSGRAVDQIPSAYISRDFALLLAVAMLGVRYWLMNMSDPPTQQSTPVLYTVQRLWSTRSPFVMFCAEQNAYNDYAGGYYTPLSPHMMGAVADHENLTRRSGGGGSSSDGSSVSTAPYASRPMNSAYLSATQRTLALERAANGNNDPAAKGDARRTYGAVAGDVTTQDLLHRVVGGVVALVHEMLYWGFVIGCALPLLNNGLFAELSYITYLRATLFVVIYMASDAIMDPATETAALHVAPTLYVMSAYVFFVSPWMLFACVLHLVVLVTYVVVHARAGDLPWSRWACINNLRREYASRFGGAARVPVAQSEVGVVVMGGGIDIVDGPHSDDDSL